MFRRSVAVSLVSMVLACLSASSDAVSWMGNTKLYEGGNRYPNAGFYLEDSQSLTITTETWPIATGQQVKAIVTTNNWQTSQEYVFSFDFNANNNSHWYCVLPKFPKNTRIQFYLRADEWQNGTVFDNNGSQNFRYFVRPAPRYSDTPILQWFQTDYKTIMARLPEVVQAGYGAIYLPAPQKSGGGGFSTGYNPFDPFDLGDRLAKGTVRTQ
jgi:alpha-amylase